MIYDALAALALSSASMMSGITGSEERSASTASTPAAVVTCIRLSLLKLKEQNLELYFGATLPSRSVTSSFTLFST